VTTKSNYPELPRVELDALLGYLDDCQHDIHDISFLIAEGSMEE
jgi:hypothetical protein